MIGGCPLPSGGSVVGAPNRSDATNGGARFAGSTACTICHADVAALHALHGHAQILRPIQGVAPVDPRGDSRPGIPDPPGGRPWADISYIIGGYVKAARFVDQQGYVLTTGLTGQNSQWNLDFPANGTIAGFSPYEPGRSSPLAYDFSCFQCHTTGSALDPMAPRFQDGRPGMLGTWNETGVQCEACHGPGGEHFGTESGNVVIHRDRIFIDPDGARTCANCHNQPFGGQNGEIFARGGFLWNQAQEPELRASGGHRAFACTYCHDPHQSLTVDRSVALRNDCVPCHTGQSMAGHGGKVFRRGDYSEPLNCESCHMPYASRNAHQATAEIVGPSGRMGDTRTHVFRIDVRPVNFAGMLSNDGQRVLRDAQGRAAVTVDFVCLRCHNGLGSVFSLSVARAAEIADRVHELP